MNSRSIRIAAALWSLAFGCGPNPAAVSDESTGDAMHATHDDGSLPSATGTSIASTSDAVDATTVNDSDATFGPADDSSDGGVGFIPFSDVIVCGQGLPPGTLAHCSSCDLFAQDCPKGEKCMPFANDGGPHWNSSRCSPIDGNPAQLGEPCTVMGSEVSGVDDCDLGLMCLYVDPDTLEGTCVAMCQGSPEEPMCEEGLTCAMDNDGAINLCLPPCDPLVGDCDLGTCIPVDDAFVCFADGAAQLPGEPCELAVDCGAGSTCMEATGSCGRGGETCCASFCDLSLPEPNAVCLPGEVCTAWYQRGAVPPPLDTIGVCLDARVP